MKILSRSETGWPQTHGSHQSRLIDCPISELPPSTCQDDCQPVAGQAENFKCIPYIIRLVCVSVISFSKTAITAIMSEKKRDPLASPQASNLLFPTDLLNPSAQGPSQSDCASVYLGPEALFYGSSPRHSAMPSGEDCHPHQMLRDPGELVRKIRDRRIPSTCDRVA